MAKKKTAIVASETDEDIYEQLLGVAFRYAEFEPTPTGMSVAHVGPEDLTPQQVEKRFDFYRTYEPTMLRKFCALDVSKAPPELLVYGVCTDETDADEILTSLANNLVTHSHNQATTKIFWEDY